MALAEAGLIKADETMWRRTRLDRSNISKKMKEKEQNGEGSILAHTHPLSSQNHSQQANSASNYKNIS